MHPVPIFHKNLKIENCDLTLAYSFFGNVMNEWPFVTLEGYIPVKKISIRPPSRWNHSNIRFKILKFAFSLKVFSVFNMWSWNKTLREDNNVNALTQHLIVANLFKDTYVPIMPFLNLQGNCRTIDDYNNVLKIISYNHKRNLNTVSYMYLYFMYFFFFFLPTDTYYRWMMFLLFIFRTYSTF